MKNQFLIPANSKKSTLILSLFTPFDLGLFAGGICLSMLMLLIISPNSIWGAIIDLAPGVIGAFLVLPLPNYHNALTLIKEIYLFYTRRRCYVWKGWCVKDEFGDK